MNSSEPLSTLTGRSEWALDWPRPSPAAAFSARRERLRSRLSGPAIFASGWPKPRNFPHNQHPFRAESHFLYLVGKPLEGAALVIDRGGAVLYATPPDPGDSLWHGPEPSLRDLAAELGLEVRPLSELTELPGAATLAPQDPRARHWLEALLRRPVVSPALEGLAVPDSELAEIMIELRLVHDGAALEQMRQAARATAAAHLAGMQRTRPGLREAQVSGVMQAVIVGAGMSLAYGPIVTVEGQVLHARRHDRVLSPSDLLLVDVGAETPEGWAADVTRTWPVSGRFSSTQRAVYDAVLEAQRAALALVRPGVRYSDVHAASQRALASCLIDLKILRGPLDEVLAKHALALFYPHGVGHLLGLDVHDMEDLGDRAGYAPGRRRQVDPSRRFLRLDRDLKAGMVVTIEPGFYWIPDLLNTAAPGSALHALVDWDQLERFRDVKGIRIEDDVLVTEAGHEILSGALVKGASEIEAAMAQRRQPD